MHGRLLERQASSPREPARIARASSRSAAHTRSSSVSSRLRHALAQALEDALRGLHADVGGDQHLFDLLDAGWGSISCLPPNRRDRRAMKPPRVEARPFLSEATSSADRPSCARPLRAVAGEGRPAAPGHGAEELVHRALAFRQRSRGGQLLRGQRLLRHCGRALAGVPGAGRAVGGSSGFLRAAGRRPATTARTTSAMINLEPMSPLRSTASVRDRAAKHRLSRGALPLASKTR